MGMLRENPNCINSFKCIIKIFNFFIFIKKITSKKVGFSDHTIGPLAPSYAVALGAEIIEKHFTIDNKLEGADHAMSANPNVFKEMVRTCNDFVDMLGERRLNSHYDCEKNSLQFCSEDTNNN